MGPPAGSTQTKMAASTSRERSVNDQTPFFLDAGLNTNGLKEEKNFKNRNGIN